MNIKVLDGAAPDLPPLVRAALLVLVAARRPVPAGELAEMLWERPPESPRPVIKLMSRLRERLGAKRVSHDEGVGYRFTPQAGDYIDLWAWYALVDKLYELTLSDPHAAALLYERALGLWADPPLAGLPATTAMDTLRRRLLDERLDLVERQTEVRLSLGRHREVVASLRPLAESEPQREHLRYLLMLALYGAQRPAEARALYQELSERLRGDGGAQPGRALQRLYQQIRAADPALDVEPVPLPAADRAVLAAGGSPARMSTARMGLYVAERESGPSSFSTALERAATEFILVAAPEITVLQRDSERFGARVVRRLAVDHHIQQFIELGALPPGPWSVHRVARLPRPAARVVYAHRERALVGHARGLLHGQEGVAFVHATLLDPRSILDDPQVKELIDWSRPVAVIDRQETNNTSETDDPGRLFGELMAATAPGSVLAVTTVTGESMTDLVAARLAEAYQDAPDSERLVLRSRARLAELIPPGFRLLTPITDLCRLWADQPGRPGPFRSFGAVAVRD